MANAVSCSRLSRKMFSKGVRFEFDALIFRYFPVFKFQLSFFSCHVKCSLNENQK